jgi:hypothetical protein
MTLGDELRHRFAALAMRLSRAEKTNSVLG